MARRAKIMKMLVLLILCGSAWGSEPIPGMISYWKLDDTNGTSACDLLGDNHGTIHGDAVWTSGQVGGALSFDGNGDYVKVPHNDNLNLVSEGTVVAWVNLNSSYRQGIVTKQPSTDAGNYFLITSSSNRMGFGITNGIWAGGTMWVCTPGEAITNEWAFYTGTFDSSTVSFYENGVLVGSRANTITPITTSAPLYIGRWANDTDWDCNGSIDEVAIYNRCLSPEEIQQLYQNGLSGQGYPVDLKIIAINKINRTIDEKAEMLGVIDEMLSEERDAYEALEELLESGDYGELKKGDIVTAKQKIHSAMQHQEQAADALEKSIEKLEDSLAALGWEPPADELTQD